MTSATFEFHDYVRRHCEFFYYFVVCTSALIFPSQHFLVRQQSPVPPELSQLKFNKVLVSFDVNL